MSSHPRIGPVGILVGLFLLGCGSTAANPRPKRDASTTGGSGGSSFGGSGGGGGSSFGGSGGGGGSSFGGSGGAGGAVPVDAARDALADSPPDRVREAGPDLPPALPSGLVGYWKFDETTGTTTRDEAGSANDGVVATGATLVPGGFPSAMFPNPGALALDGVMSRVTLGVNRLPNVDGPKTIALWFNYTTTPAGTRDFVSLTNGGLFCGVQVGVRSNMLGVWGWGGTVAQLLQAPLPGPGWHQLTYTFDGSQNTLTIDGGTPVVSTTAPQACDVFDAVVGSYFGGRENFGGTIDDLRIYNRALGASEIATLAAGGDPTPVPRPDAGRVDAAVDAAPPDAAVDAAPPDAAPDAAADGAGN
jgi:hypothetical protein